MSGPAGNAVLDPDVLVDSLVTDVIDSLRGELYPEFGVRAYTVFLVTRRWTGARVGEGKYTDTAIEMVTQPKVQVWDGFKYDLLACGLNSSGVIRLQEVSLSYTYADLIGDETKPNVQSMIRIDEAHGQGTPSSFWVHSQPPFIDREKTLGWVLWLKKFDSAGGGL